MARQNTTSDIKKSGGLVKFFKEVKFEMKKVIWPTKKELISYTIIVFITVLFVALLIFVIDIIFSEIFKIFANFLK